MNRRQFNRITTLGIVGLSLTRRTSTARFARPQVAITMDDFNWAGETVRLTGAQRNQAILSALKFHSIKAALFVKAANIDNDEGKALLQEWNNAGHLIGNHTYSHPFLNSSKMTAEAFEQDMLHAEELLKNFTQFQKILRFPYLKEGETVMKRDAIRSFLAQRGYRIGHVTIDASDWYIDDRLRKRLTKEPAADVSAYRNYYMDHMWDRAVFYDDLSRKVLGRSVKHCILVHFNLLNALFLDDLVSMFKSKGWQVIDASEAFRDRIYAAQPKTVPAGESLIWALAKETGRFDKLLRYPGEDGEYEAPKMDKLGL